MCECLEYEDGEMHLCVVCADEWRDYQKLLSVRARSHWQSGMSKASDGNWFGVAQLINENDEVVAQIYTDRFETAWYYGSRKFLTKDAAMKAVEQHIASKMPVIR